LRFGHDVAEDGAADTLPSDAGAVRIDFTSP
jgi:hypothetical protein